MVLMQGMRVVGVGIAIGLAAGAAFSPLLASQLHGIGPLDPWTHLGAAAFLAVIALLACYIPARHATKVDPIEVLKCE